MTTQPPQDSQPQRSGPGRGTEIRRFRDLPPWVQGWTAVIGVAIAAIGLLFTAIQVLGPRTPGPTAIVIRPEAFIERMTPGLDGIAAIGRFRNLAIGAEKVYVLGEAPVASTQPSATPVRLLYLPAIEARVTTALPSAAGERVDGTWEATIPLDTEGGLTWWAVVMSAGSAAGGGLEDLRVNGPASSLVLAASEPFTTGE